MLNIDRLLAFVDVVETGSLTVAAERRGVTKAAISKQISLLETECGAQLINRANKPIFFTEIGLELYEKTKKLKNSLKEIDIVISELKNMPERPLRVFSGINFAKFFIFPELKRWFDTYPLVSLDLEIGEWVPDMHKENYDVVVGTMACEDSSIIKTTLGNMRYYLCASPKYIEKWGLPNDLEDLRSHRYLTHSSKKQNCLITANNEEIFVEPFFYLNNFQGLVQLAVDGIGVILASSMVVAPYLKNGNLIELLPEKFKDSWKPINVYYKDSRFVSLKIRAFLQFLKECFANHSGSYR